MKWPGSCAAIVFVVLASQRKNIRIISLPDEIYRVVGNYCTNIVATSHRKQIEAIPRDKPSSHSREPPRPYYPL